MLTLVVLLLASVCYADLTIASFNIRIYSTGSRTDAELELIADRLQQFDLIAVQEVRDEEVVARTLDILSRRGDPYEAVVSGPVGNVVKERYAFFWRPDKVRLTMARVFVDSLGYFLREPFIAAFVAGEFDFVLATIHVVFGDGVRERRAEVERLGDVVWSSLEQDDDVILLGDFNLPPDDPGWTNMRSIGMLPAVWFGNPTVISDYEIYDNFWLDPRWVTEWTGEVGVDRFDETVFGDDDAAASLAVSDHRPIWARFSTAGPDDDEGQATAVLPSSWGRAKLWAVDPGVFP